MTSRHIVKRPNLVDTRSNRAWADCAGIAASLGCAVHCALMPLVIGYLPALGLSWLVDEGFHQWMGAICFVLAAAAFIPAWRRHGRILPAAIGLAGLGLLTAAALGIAGPCCPSGKGQTSDNGIAACKDEGCSHCVDTARTDVANEHNTLLFALGNSTIVPRIAPWLTPLGGMLLVAGHVLNRRCVCGCAAAPPPS